MRRLLLLSITFLISFSFVQSKLPPEIKKQDSFFEEYFSNGSKFNKNLNFQNIDRLALKRLIDASKLDSKHFLPNHIFVKLKKNSGSIVEKDNQALQGLNLLYEQAGVVSIKAPFKVHLKKDGVLSEDKHGISRIYELRLDGSLSSIQAAALLMSNPAVEYAEPVPVRFPYEFTPNDPLRVQQYALSRIDLYEAWEITKGSKDVKIAIVDAGVEWSHEDLAANIWKNPGEIAGDSIDNDANGKIDDVRGWDFVGDVSYGQAQSGIYNEDNNPDAENPEVSHGTHVAGCASAVTDNETGVAAPGFNCSIIPVKVCPDETQNGLFNTYAGILYAANLGADVINCSWGGPGYSQAEQDIINQAHEMGSVVVTAAGNDGHSIEDYSHYPSNYENVLCVGSSDSGDKKSNFSNFGRIVDVYAPGSSILSTYPNDNYNGASGTSMAAPIVSGICGLIKSIHPDWTPQQVMSQIRTTSENVLTDDEEIRALVYGRVNAFNALNYNQEFNIGMNAPGLYITNVEIGTDGYLSDTKPTNLKFTITNVLSNVQGLSLKIKAVDDFLKIYQDNIAIGNLSSQDSRDIELNIQLENNNPWFDGNAYIQVKFEASGYEDYGVITIPIFMESENFYNIIEKVDLFEYVQFHGASTNDKNNAWFIGNLYGQIGFYVNASNSIRANPIAQEPMYAVAALSQSTAFTASSPNNGNSSIYKTANYGNSWQKQSISQVTGFVNGMHFFDEQNGVFLGDSKNSKWGVGYTEDGGDTWTQVTDIDAPVFNEAGLVGCYYFDSDGAWFGSNEGKIYMSSDKGKTWESSTLIEGQQIYKVCITEPGRGIAAYVVDESDIHIALTTNGGTTWNEDVFNFSATLSAAPAYFYSPENSSMLIAVCTDSRVFSSDNLGRSWEPVLTKKVGNVGAGTGYSEFGRMRLFMGDVIIGYLDVNYLPDGAKYEITSTSGDILDFDSVLVDNTESEKIEFENTGDLIVNIDSLKIKYFTSEDEALDEFSMFNPQGVELYPGDKESYTIRFRPGRQGPVTAELDVYTDKAGMKRIDLKGVGVVDTGIEDNLNSSMLQIKGIYPNPASTGAEIKFQIPNAGKTSISVYNILGNNMLDLETYSQAGNNSLFIPLHNLPAGIYMLQINSENYSAASQLIIQK